MKSWFHDKTVTGSVLRLREVLKPMAMADEILIRVQAASLNRGEFLARQKLPATAEPKPAGIECAGEVVQVGAGVKGFAPGDRVMGRAAMAFSEFATMRSGEALRVPERLSWEEAAGASITYLVAYDMLWPGGSLQQDEWLLITGVSSGVGVAALQLGKLLGAKVIGTSRSTSKLERLQSLGLDLGISDLNADFQAQVMTVTAGQGVNLVVNNVGGSAFAACMRVLAYRGRLATVGNLDGQGTAEIDLLAQHAKRLQLFGVSNKLRSAEEMTSSVSGFTQAILPAMADGRVTPLIDKIYPFTDLPEALMYMESNEQLGKIVISI